MKEKIEKQESRDKQVRKEEIRKVKKKDRRRRKEWREEKEQKNVFERGLKRRKSGKRREIKEGE